MADEYKNLDPKVVAELTLQYEKMGKTAQQIKEILITLNKVQKETNKLASDYNVSGAQTLRDLRQKLRIQKDIKKDAKAYREYLKDIKDLDEEINAIEAQKLKLRRQGSEANAEAIKYLEEESKELRAQKQLIADQLAKAKGFRTNISAIGQDLKKVNDGFGKVTGFFNRAYNFFDVGTMFKMLKTIKTTSMEMGVIGKRSDVLSQNIKRASVNAIKFGVELEDIAKIQSSFSDELGTTQFISQDALENLGAIGKVTGIGAEGAGKMAGELGKVGMSAGSTAKFINQTYNDAAKMGLNSAKVIKLIQNNIKLLNKYNFKGGVKGLARMAESTTRMGVSMEMASGMAEKLFDIEGAVEMSSQLQVMGGKWSQLADPFKLMYMARNDMAGLTESIIDATKGAATFNKESGQFEISSLEMHRLRKVAEAAGLNYEELAQSAKRAAQFTEINKQLKFKIDPDTQKFIENTAYFDEKGKAMIMVGAEPKYLDALSEQDKQRLKEDASLKATMQERAKFAVTFDEQLKYLFTMLKTMALPLIEELNRSLVPKLDDVMKKLSAPKFVQSIEEFAKKIPRFVDAAWEFGKKIYHFVKSIGEWVANNKTLIWTLTKWGTGVALAFGALKWLYYGMQLGSGFNMVARVGGMGPSRGVGPSGGNGSGGGGRFGRMGGGVGLGIAGMGVGMLTDAYTDPGSGANILGSAASGALTGAALGSMIGPWGTAIGAVLGGLYGGISAYNSKPNPQENQNAIPMHDGVIFNPKDKFMKINDGAMIAGTNVNGNNNLAKAILKASAPTFDKGGQLRGNVQSNTSSNKPVKIEHSDLKIGGTIEIKLGGEVDRKIGSDLLNDPIFIRNMSRMVNEATQKSLNDKTK
jgi:hypothetical protein